jgi:hypothetical protein
LGRKEKGIKKAVTALLELVDIFLLLIVEITL